jgi:hypothetical protein
MSQEAIIGIDLGGTFCRIAGWGLYAQTPANPHLCPRRWIECRDRSGQQRDADPEGTKSRDRKKDHALNEIAPAIQRN